MSRPVILLDVDGVIGVMLAHPAAADNLVRIDPASRHGDDAFVDPRAPGWLARLVAVADLMWASSWEADANDLLAGALGLPALPWVDLAGSRLSPRDGCWKRPAVQRALDAMPGRPAAWVDDELTVTDFAWASTRGVQLVRTRATVGLTEQHVSRLEAWAARHGTAPTAGTVRAC